MICAVILFAAADTAPMYFREALQSSQKSEQAQNLLNSANVGEPSRFQQNCITDNVGRLRSDLSYRF